MLGGGFLSFQFLFFSHSGSCSTCSLEEPGLAMEAEVSFSEIALAMLRLVAVLQDCWRVSWVP